MCTITINAIRYFILHPIIESSLTSLHSPYLTLILCRRYDTYHTDNTRTTTRWIIVTISVLVHFCCIRWISCQSSMIHRHTAVVAVFPVALPDTTITHTTHVWLMLVLQHYSMMSNYNPYDYYSPIFIHYCSSRYCMVYCNVINGSQH